MHVFYGLFACPVAIRGKLCGFKKSTLLPEIIECFLVYEMIRLAILFAAAWFTSGIYGRGALRSVCARSKHSLTVNRRRFDARETLNLNLSGWSRKRRCSRVLFPVPLGPEMTSGLVIKDIGDEQMPREAAMRREGTRTSALGRSLKAIF